MRISDWSSDVCSSDLSGAGTLVWVRRYDLAEFAVVLEPEETLAAARRAFYVGMNALADALSFHEPPERPVSFDWPDAIRIDGVVVGGGRLGWPDEASEDEIPSWLVFSGMVRTFAIHAGEPGLRPLHGALDEVGFEEADSAEIIASFTRHLMAGFHDRNEASVAAEAENWLARLPREDRERFCLAANGDLLVFQGEVPEPVERRKLVLALATPSRSEEHTSELQSLMRISYAVFCLKKKKQSSKT